MKYSALKKNEVQHNRSSSPALIFLLSILLLFGLNAVAQSPALMSGQPMSGASPGRFALPSLTGYVMGTAVLDNGSTALFMESDVRNPGTYLYYFKNFAANGAPVFSAPTTLVLPPAADSGSDKGCIIQDMKKRIWGFWRKGKYILAYQFDQSTLRFKDPLKLEIKGLPSRISGFGVGELEKGKFVFLFGVAAPTPPGEKEMKFDSLYYTPEGLWPVKLPEMGVFGGVSESIEKEDPVQAIQLTDLNEIYYQVSGFSLYKREKDTYAIMGTRTGNFYAYHLNKDPLTAERKYAVDENNILLRTPSKDAFLSYIKLDKKEGLIASGEGGFYYYERSPAKDSKGNLAFKDAVTVMQENPVLYGGSLVVPDMADWDGDGATDLISGSSDGHILFFKNTGTNRQPVYQAPAFLEAGGRVIHIQPGYREDIQGPGEGRWGYTCPTVIDWNEDGLPDILTGDSRGKFMVYINKGTVTKPQLEPEHPLYFKGLDVFGAWRTKPGAGKLGNRMAYIILDEDNQFHLYWKLDDHNIEDGGKLTLTDKTYISANRRPGGQVGRANIHLVDWDEDGITDLLVGTGRAMSIPNPENGLPYNRKKKNEGGAVLFLRNAGSNEQPVFEYPRMLKYKGNDMLFGAHSCSPTTAFIGESRSMSLIVGVESGKYMFYDKKDLSW